MLRRRGKVEDDEVAAVEDDGSVPRPCMAASVQRVGALGKGEGRALRRPGRRRDAEVERVQRRRCADVDGFSLHADVGVPARDRAQLERLCRYVARPATASERLSLLADGRVRYNFERTWRDGSVAMEFDPIDFVGKLAALVPRPRSKLMQRVFAIDVLLCPSCGARMKPIAEITDRRVAQTMLEHVGVPSDAPEPWSARGPPASVGASRWLDHEPRADEPAPDVE